MFGLFALVWHANPQRDFIDQLWSYGLALGVFAAATQGAGRWSRNRILGFFADISYRSMSCMASRAMSCCVSCWIAECPTGSPFRW